MKTMLRTLLSGVLVTLAAAPAASASHAWSTYHWARQANPFTVRLGSNVTGDWVGHLGTASADWTQSAVMDTAVVAGNGSKRCSMTTGTVQVCNARYGSTGWLGLASINLSGGHISQGSAKMNDTYFGTATYNNPNEKLHVMCQEVGHTFGLDHQSTDGSSQDTCMDYFSNTGANAASTLSTHPNAHDYDQLSTIYAHLDATTTLASSPAASPGKAGQPGARPYRTERTDRREQSVLVEYYDDGTERVTYVTWVDGPRPAVEGA